MMNIVLATHPDAGTVHRLLAVWHSAVKATHHFLSPQDMDELVPLVRAAVSDIDPLYTAVGEDGAILGFLGVDSGKIEMLFVDDSARGKGVGKALIRHAIVTLGARTVDVNEQNPQGVGFYLHMGFRQVSRSETDGQGKPFPILHMELTDQGEAQWT